jgi:hypothetical protein
MQEARWKSEQRQNREQPDGEAAVEIGGASVNFVDVELPVSQRGNRAEEERDGGDFSPREIGQPERRTRTPGAARASQFPACREAKETRHGEGWLEKQNGRAG